MLSSFLFGDGRELQPFRKTLSSTTFFVTLIGPTIKRNVNCEEPMAVEVYGG